MTKFTNLAKTSVARQTTSCFYSYSNQKCNRLIHFGDIFVFCFICQVFSKINFCILSIKLIFNADNKYALQWCMMFWMFYYDWYVHDTLFVQFFTFAEKQIFVKKFGKLWGVVLFNDLELGRICHGQNWMNYFKFLRVDQQGWALYINDFGSSNFHEKILQLDRTENK